MFVFQVSIHIAASGKIRPHMPLLFVFNWVQLLSLTEYPSLAGILKSRPAPYLSITRCLMILIYQHNQSHGSWKLTRPSIINSLNSRRVSSPEYNVAILGIWHRRGDLTVVLWISHIFILLKSLYNYPIRIIRSWIIKVYCPPRSLHRQKLFFEGSTGVWFEFYLRVVNFYRIYSSLSISACALGSKNLGSSD